MVTHRDASRDDLLDFIETTWNIRVGLTALHRFLNQYGLDRQSLEDAAPPEPPHPGTDEPMLLEVLDKPPACGLPVPRPPDDFFWPDRICRRLPVASSSAPLVERRPAVLLR
ncbi:MAG: hypothetical protein ACYTG0_22070 [Planctomycetota bacterium]